MEIDGIEYRVAETRDDIEGAMRLVYTNYLDMDYCDRNGFEMYLYLFDLLPKTRTLTALRDGQVIGTLTLVFDSDPGVPSDHLYHAELERLRLKKRRIVEISKLAFDRSLSTRRYHVLLQMFRMSWIFTQHVRRSTDICILVEPTHESFYRSRLMMERIGALREDTDAGGAPSVLMRLNLETMADRYRAAYSGKPLKRNLYHFCWGDPNVKKLELEIFSTDQRLTQLNRRLLEKQLPAQSSSEISASMSTYLDFRMFVIKLVMERITQRAQASGKLGRFREQIDLYEKLVAAMPVNYRPNDLASIYDDIGIAAWYCGMYERALDYARKMQELTDDPDLTGAAHNLAGIALHFQSRRPEAMQELNRGLAVSGLSGYTHAMLLRMAGRFHIDNQQLDKAESCFNEASEILENVPNSLKRNRLIAMLGHDRFVLARRHGDIIKAGEALAWAAPFLVDAGHQLMYMFLEARATVEHSLGRPREALKYCQMADSHISTMSNPYNASVLYTTIAGAHLSAGDLRDAVNAARRSLTYAHRARSPGAIASAVLSLIHALIAEDRLDEAKDTLEDNIDGIDKNATPRIWATLEQSKATLAMAENRFDDAIQSLEIVELLIENETTYLSRIRLEKAAALSAIGRMDDTRSILAELPAEEAYPGKLTYAAMRRALRSVIAESDGHPGDAVALFNQATETYLAGDAMTDAADIALLVVKITKTIESSNCPGGLSAAAHSLLKTILDTTDLPRHARLLRDTPMPNP